LGCASRAELRRKTGTMNTLRFDGAMQGAIAKPE
jgi:hypothetical protein